MDAFRTTTEIEVKPDTANPGFFVARMLYPHLGLEARARGAVRAKAFVLRRYAEILLASFPPKCAEDTRLPD